MQLLLNAGNIKKFYGERLIFELEKLTIYEGDKIGIVGLNGAGKTTLLHILSGEISADEGFVKRYCSITYLKQFGTDDNPADIKLLKEFKVADKLSSEKVSGGETTRLKLAQALSENNPILFADEPTSNLDIQGVSLIKDKLSQVNSMLLISHDRELLDSLCNKIIEVKDGKIKIYIGNYSDYDEQRQREFQTQMSEYEKYTKKKKELEDAVENRENRSKVIKKAPSRMGNSEARLHKGKTSEKKKKIESAAAIIKTHIEKLEPKEKPKENEKIKLDFSLTNPPQNKIVISGEGITFSYNENPIFKNASFKIENSKRIAIVGENGAGKTTLLNLINQGYDGIKKAPKATLGYFYQGFENLDFNKSVLENVMADSIQNETTVRTILARLLLTSQDIQKKAAVLSGGERIKAAFAKLFVSSANVLLLDEPTNYLDMQSIEALQDILSDYDGTLLFVSHDKKLVNAVADKLLLIENEQLTLFDGNLSKYEALKTQKTPSRNCDKLLLEMKLTDIISRLSLSNEDKGKLEIEYKEIREQLDNMV